MIVIQKINKKEIVLDNNIGINNLFPLFKSNFVYTRILIILQFQAVTQERDTILGSN